MSDYVRPPISLAEFRDDEGNVIPYGNRWQWHDGPPDDSYSVNDHPERFAPLHTVAEALIDYFATNFDVAVEEGYHVTDNLPNAPKADEIVRAVRISPRSKSSAPLVFVLTKCPSVRLSSGAFFTNSYPVCGCNACDEDPKALVEALESEALSIAGGGLTEQIGKPLRSKIHFNSDHGHTLKNEQVASYALKGLDGESESGGGQPVQQIPAAILDEVRIKLAKVAAASPDGNWQAWPLKS